MGKKGKGAKAIDKPKTQPVKGKKWKKMKPHKAPKPKAKQTMKQVKFCNGNCVYRIIDEAKGTEEWHWHSYSLSNIEYTIDLDGSKGVKFDDGKAKHTLTLPQFGTYKHKLTLDAGSKIEFHITYKEELAALQDQFDYISQTTPNLLLLVQENKEYLETCRAMS